MSVLEQSLEINDLIVHLKKLEKEKNIKPKEIKRKRHIHQNATALKTLSKILSTICNSKDERMIGL